MMEMNLHIIIIIITFKNIYIIFLELNGKKMLTIASDSSKIEGGRCHISKNVMTQQCQLNH